MKILYVLENVQSGSISFRKGTKIGYLDQIPDFENEITVLEILKMAFIDVYNVKKELDEISRSFSYLKDEELEIALKKYTMVNDIFEGLKGYDIERNINKVCSGLKINDEMRNMQFSLLSGGEKTRVMLAKILLEQPSLLMLDEPSNHLDLESIQWLENYLNGYDGSVLIVSHDRYFLDSVCKKLIELSSNKAHVYHGNYSYYVIEKERRFLLELKVYLSQERQIKRMEEQIKRYRIWGVMRDSDKMFKRAKELEKRLSKIERLDKPRKENPKFKVSDFNMSRSGKRVLEADNITKSFDSIELLVDAEIEVIFKDRLAILGNNGSGKTTLIKMLLEDFESDNRTFKWGSRLKIGYLAQEVNFEDENNSVLEYFMNEHNVAQNVARNELAKALFIRDDVLKKIKVLSGGEKSKLKLCSLTFDKTNFLILDEPTNHLDIDSREVLEEMLNEFVGTILFISHDRFFIKKIASRIGEIEDKQITYYEGDYEYYLDHKTMEKKNTQKPKNEVKNIQKDFIRPKVNTEETLQKMFALEERIKENQNQSKLFAYDFDKLHELYLEKEKLEKEMEELFSLIEE